MKCLPGPNPPRNTLGGFKVVGLGAYEKAGSLATRHNQPGERGRKAWLAADCGFSPCGHTLSPHQWNPAPLDPPPSALGNRGRLRKV